MKGTTNRATIEKNDSGSVKINSSPKNKYPQEQAGHGNYTDSE
jgi:hypothetical protein